MDKDKLKNYLIDLEARVSRFEREKLENENLAFGYDFEDYLNEAKIKIDKLNKQK